MTTFVRPSGPRYRDLHPYAVIVFDPKHSLKSGYVYRSHKTYEGSVQSAKDLNHTQKQRADVRFAFEPVKLIQP